MQKTSEFSAHGANASRQPKRVVTGGRKLSWFAAMLVKLDGILERRQSLHELTSLDDAALKDIGLSRADVVRETARGLWTDRAHDGS